MLTTVPHNAHDNAPAPVVLVAFELREKTWKLGFPIGPGRNPRERPIAARDPKRVLAEVAEAKKRFGLPATTSVIRGYEAGREGFWRHRLLQAQGLTNHVVDSSSSEVNRRKRRAKREGWDVCKWLRMLRRYPPGERDVWRMVHVPSVEAEDQRYLPRDLDTLKQERARTTTRLKGLRSRPGVRLSPVSQWPEQLEALRLWEGSPHGVAGFWHNIRPTPGPAGLARRAGLPHRGTGEHGVYWKPIYPV